MSERIPCRVSAELRAHQRRQDQYTPEDFDPWQNEHVEAVVPSTLARPVQVLLLALSQIELTERSFGVDSQKAYETLIQPLKDFRDACREAWKNRE